MLKFKIVTPEKIAYEDEVDQVVATTSKGEIGILPNHANLLARIVPGEIRITKGSKEHILATGSGLLEIADNVLQITTDMAEDLEAIDEKVAEEARQRALEAKEKSQSDEEYALAEAALEKALAQLKVKRRHRVR